MEGVANACGALLDGLEGSLYVGFSGGMDSTVLLLHALASRAAERGRLAALSAVHVDHGLDPESGEWSRRCAATAARLGVAFHSEALALEPGPNVEARARNGRYRVFEALLGPGDVLALAHHADDQAESVLLHLLQGRGLYGMPAERPLGGGRLVRPLLNLPRVQLAAYASTHGLEWTEDPTNEDLSLDRNFLRRQVLPALAERFPELPKKLERLAASTAATTRALVEALDLERNPLPLAVLDGLSRPVRLAVLRQWLVVQDAATGVSDAALADFLEQLESAHDRQPALDVGERQLRRYRRRLYLLEVPPVLNADYPMACPGELVLPHGTLSVHAAPAPASEAVTLTPDVRVTFSAALERGATLRVRGSGRRLKELLRAAGLPPWERAVQPILVDAAGVAAVPGVAIRDPLPPSRSAGRFWLRWEPSRGGP